MDNEEFLSVTNYDPPTPEMSSARNLTPSLDMDWSVDPLYNKYVVIGVFLLFVALFFLSVVYYLLKGADNSCCYNDRFTHLYSLPSDDAVSFTDSEDDLHNMYTSCHLYVDDSEMNTTADGFEYDCVSVDVTEEERTFLIKQNRQRQDAYDCLEPCTIHAVP